MKNQKQKEINPKAANDVFKWLRTLKSSIVTGVEPEDFAKMEAANVGVGNE